MKVWEPGPSKKNHVTLPLNLGLQNIQLHPLHQLHNTQHKTKLILVL